jgi:hypothetical protein
LLGDAASDQALAIFGAMVPIIVMPPHIIIIGMPAFIMVIMRWQQSMNISFMAASIGAISQVMPVGVMVQVILHAIIIIGMFMPIPIIGICIGIMPPIIGMFMGIMFIGIMACIGIAFISRLHRVGRITPSLMNFDRSRA